MEYLELLGENNDTKVCTETNESHIYLRKIVAQYYESSFIRNFPISEFEQFMNNILSSYFSSEEYKLEILEGGTGTGILSIPTIQYILSRDRVSTFTGVDNSYPMLKILSEKEEFKRLNFKGRERISIGFGDLEEPLTFFSSSFNVILLGGVLHCLNKLDEFLWQVDKILKSEGYLFITFKSDESTKIQCGAEIKESENLDNKYTNFWQYYHRLRKDHRLPIESRCSLIYDVELVKGLIKNQLNNRYTFLKNDFIPWSAKTTFEQMIAAIEHGLTFVTGQGVSNNQRKYLSNKMNKWVKQNRLMQREVDIKNRVEVAVWKKTA